MVEVVNTAIDLGTQQSAIAYHVAAQAQHTGHFRLHTVTPAPVQYYCVYTPEPHALRTLIKSPARAAVLPGSTIASPCYMPANRVQCMGCQTQDARRRPHVSHANPHHTCSCTQDRLVNEKLMMSCRLHGCGNAHVASGTHPHLPWQASSWPTAWMRCTACVRSRVKTPPLLTLAQCSLAQHGSMYCETAHGASNTTIELRTRR